MRKALSSLVLALMLGWAGEVHAEELILSCKIDSVTETMLPLGSEPRKWKKTVGEEFLKIELRNGEFISGELNELPPWCGGAKKTWIVYDDSIHISCLNKHPDGRESSVTWYINRLNGKYNNSIWLKSKILSYSGVCSKINRKF